MKKRLGSYAIDRRGNFAVLAALSALPLIVMMGGAVDMTRVRQVEERLGRAADAAVLAAARLAAHAAEDRERAAHAMFAANIVGIEGASGTLVQDGRNFSYRAKKAVRFAFLPLIRIREVPVERVATAATGSRNVDIVLVLDNSASMSGGRRIDELKKAAKAFIDEIAGTGGGAQIAIVPFDEVVSAGPGLIDRTNSISYRVDLPESAGTVPTTVPDQEETRGVFAKLDAGSWSGCILDRFMPHDALGTTPSVKDAATLYPRKDCSGTKLAPVRALGTDFDAMKAHVDSLRPNGLTNSTIGLQWGIEALSPEAPLTGSKAGADRIMILITDGRNTDSRWTTTSRKIDARMQIACRTAKDQGIEIFTINLLEGDKDQLRDCATDPAHFFNVSNLSELLPVFRNIAARMSDLRLSG